MLCEHVRPIPLICSNRNATRLPNCSRSLEKLEAHCPSILTVWHCSGSGSPSWQQWGAFVLCMLQCTIVCLCFHCRHCVHICLLASEMPHCPFHKDLKSLQSIVCVQWSLFLLTWEARYSHGQLAFLSQIL